MDIEEVVFPVKDKRYDSVPDPDSASASDSSKSDSSGSDSDSKLMTMKWLHRFWIACHCIGLHVIWGQPQGGGSPFSNPPPANPPPSPPMKHKPGPGPPPVLLASYSVDPHPNLFQLPIRGSGPVSTVLRGWNPGTTWKVRLPIADTDALPAVSAPTPLPQAVARPCRRFWTTP